ncbi:MAG: CDP-alcohol phosphatidyltransferase family protein [Deltaproteobacteria bacterium]|nr:CDP-alcohol phosphatidyltransferase family protein [Deltaproteobacteria bacterium]MBW2384655.1 CDP-alcohol phosphatidyltransferase family protein [Deltaproteobacteria bacterium]
MTSSVTSIRNGGGAIAGPAQMVGFVFDWANAATLAGLLTSCAALVFAIRGSFHPALALALIAIIIDNVDGILARRDRARSKAMHTFGAHLDCYADFVSKGIFPSLLLLMSTDLAPAYLPVAALHICAIAVRYSYEFVPDFPPAGLSPDYSIVVFATFWLGCTALGVFSAPLLALLMLIMAALNVSPLRVPKLVGPWLISFLGLIFSLIAALLWTS